MFSGIIEGTGRVKSLERRADAARVAVQADFPIQDLQIGDSMAVNGCCLTVISRLGNTFWADVCEETMRLTTLGALQEQHAVNLERALQYGGRVGGHLVQGHVDGMGRILEVIPHEGSHEIRIDVPIPLTRYIIKKGSIAVDGVSLTIAECHGSQITVFVVPHTEMRTTFQNLQSGHGVNLEVDMVGKYIEKLAFLPAESYHADTPLGQAFRERHGFR